MPEGIGTTPAQGSTENVNTQAQPAGAASTQPQGGATPRESGGQAGNPASEAAKEAARKFKIKHQDGLEEEVDEEVVLKTYKERKGHQAAANKILQEGKAKAKQAEAALQALKDGHNLIDVIKKFGHDPRKLAEEYLAEVLREEMLDPKDRELKEKDQKLKEYEAKEAQRKAAEEKRILDEQTAKFAKQYNDEIVEALKATPIPQNKESVKKMAFYMGQAAKYKIQMSAHEAAKLVQQDLETTHTTIYRDASADQLVKLIGEEGLKKIREYETAKVRSPEDNLKKITADEQGDMSLRAKAKGGQRMNHVEWRKFNRGY